MQDNGKFLVLLSLDLSAARAVVAQAPLEATFSQMPRDHEALDCLPRHWLLLLPRARSPLQHAPPTRWSHPGCAFKRQVPADDSELSSVLQTNYWLNKAALLISQPAQHQHLPEALPGKGTTTYPAAHIKTARTILHNELVSKS